MQNLYIIVCHLQHQKCMCGGAKHLLFWLIACPNSATDIVVLLIFSKVGQIKLLPRYCRYLRIYLINRSKQFQLIHNYPLRPCSSFSFFVMTFLISSIVKSFYALPNGFSFDWNYQMKRQFCWVYIPCFNNMKPAKV